MLSFSLLDKVDLSFLMVSKLSTKNFDSVEEVFVSNSSIFIRSNFTRHKNLSMLEFFKKFMIDLEDIILFLVNQTRQYASFKYSGDPKTLQKE